MQGSGRTWRTAAEIATAAGLSGYSPAGKDWTILPNWEYLMLVLEGLGDGEGMPVIISNQPHVENAGYRHTITFFRQSGTLYVHDPWRAGRVFSEDDEDDSGFRESVRGAYDEVGGLKPQGLIEPLDLFGTSPVLDLSH